MAKKKKNGLEGDPSFNPRSMERIMRDLSKLLEQQEFDSIEDANAFLGQFIGEQIPELPIDDDPLSQAQDLIYKAYDADTPEEAIDLAKEALRTSPDCADAYVLLADIEADTVEEAHLHFQQGVEAGKRALGKAVFEEAAGHFWGLHETRPFMRALAGLAETTWLLGEYDEALQHFREILRLNPDDNQGVRYMLADCLLEDERYDDLMDLFKQYEDEVSANWLYNRALTLFCLEGENETSNKALQDAIAYNPFVPDFLTGKAKIPEEMPAYLGFGDESEAIQYALAGTGTWRNAFGAIRWLKNRAKEMVFTPKRKKRT